MSIVTMETAAGGRVHFGHQTRRWNPKMASYIYMERNGIYIIDLQQTVKKFAETYEFVKQIVAEGRAYFVGTKQAHETIREEATRCGMFYVNQRWLGGMLTNFRTIRQRVYRLKELEKMQEEGAFEVLPKRSSQTQSWWRDWSASWRHQGYE